MPLLKDFIGLFFPSLCATCQEPILSNEKVICTNCLSDLPFAEINDAKTQKIYEYLNSISKIDSIYSLFNYSTKSKTQKLVHLLKYKNQPEIGIFLGRWLAKKLTEKNDTYYTYDVIIPMPLHKSKERVRGYNQAKKLVDGMLDVFTKANSQDILIRVKRTETQTKKTRVERIQNVDSIFKLKNNAKSSLYGKSVLVVDDVITTGSTLASAIEEIQKAKPQKISVAVIGIA